MRTQLLRNERGFSLVELMVAAVCTTVVLGGAVAMTAKLQDGYRRQLEDSAGEQEARYALEWINRYLRSVGNNPFSVTTSNCPSTNTAFQGLIPNTTNDTTITIQSDSNPPDGQIGGSTTTTPPCDQSNEHVTISFDSTNHTIQFQDNASAASTRTDAVIDALHFTYLTNTQETWPAHDPNPLAPSADNIFYVQTSITIRTRTTDAIAGRPATRTLSSQVRVRSR